MRPKPELSEPVHALADVIKFKRVPRLTEAADPKSGGAGPRGRSSQSGAVGGAVAGPVGAGAGAARVVLEADYREQGQDWKKG